MSLRTLHTFLLLFIFSSASLPLSFGEDHHCSLPEALEGSWVKSEEPAILPPFSCRLYDKRYNCFMNGTVRRRIEKALQWNWQPPCFLQYRNLHGGFADWFFKKFANQSVIYIGDSKTRTVAAGFMCKLMDFDVDHTVEELHYGNVARVSFSRTGTNIVFVFSPFLCTRETESVSKFRIPDLLELDPLAKHELSRRSFDVAIIGTGAWWNKYKLVNATDQDQELYVGVCLYSVIQQVISHNPHVHVVVRGQEMQHRDDASPQNPFGNCAFESPELDISWERLISLGNTEPVAHNAVYRSIVKAFASHRVQYMGANELYKERRDLHPFDMLYPTHDCLHYCYGTVGDIESAIMYQTILSDNG